jgi:hypothetical protein
MDRDGVFERLQQGPVPDVWVLRRNSIWSAWASIRSIKAYSYAKIASVSLKVSTRKDYKNRTFINAIEVTLLYDSWKWPEVWILDWQGRAFETVLQDFTRFYGKYVVEALSVVGR